MTNATQTVINWPKTDHSQDREPHEPIKRNSESGIVPFQAAHATIARTLTYSNAGHCFPVLHRSIGNTEVLGDGGIVLGIFPDSKYWAVTVEFDPGDKVLLFTDGITEATNTRDEEYGEARLRVGLDGDSSINTATMHRKVMQEVTDFCLGNFADDATLVLISFLPSVKSLVVQ